MKKLYLLLIGFSLCLTTAYADNTLSLQSLSIDQGTTEAVLPISLTNEGNITGFQCDLYLPSGVTVVTDEYGDYMIAVARTTASRHTISTSLQADGALRILCTSMTNATFSGNSGTVLNVTLAVPESMAAGTHDMSLKNIVLSDPDANRHTSSDMTATFTVEGGGIEESVNTLSLQDLSIEQGTTEVVLPISLTNESNITGFQCDLYLPSGVTVVTDEYGDYMIAVARTTASRHTISTSLQSDGALRILCTSMTNATFSGNSGKVLSVTLSMPESMAAGTHGMSLKNIVLSDPDANRHTSQDVMSSLIVTNSNVITFQDAEVERICLANWDTNGDGLFSKDEAAAVTKLGTKFSQNKVITCFPELQYFTGLTTIDDNAFSNCSKLGNVNLPTSVEALGKFAFADCKSLKEIYIPSNISIIGSYAFYCSGLTSITIPKSVTSIETWGFGYCESLASIVIPESITSIGVNVFAGCVSLTSITIPKSVTSIRNDAFRACASLISITIPESVTSIGSSVFDGCTSLTSITIPKSVASIDNYTFKGCTGLTSVKVNWMQPLSISSGVFSNVDISADTLYVPEGAKAFYEKASVWRNFGTILEMPWIVPDDIDYVLFKDIEVERICLANWDTDGNGILLKEEAAAITDLGEVFRDNDAITSFDELKYFTGLESIAPEAFVNSHYLVSLQLPNTISIIGSSAFSCCSCLSNINIPESVTRIESWAFSHCSQLKNITFPNSLTLLGSGAFKNCSKIEAINIPANVSVIESECFMGCNDAQSVAVAEDNPFYDSRDNCNAIIETATNTLMFGSKNTTVIPNTITSIGVSAFANAGKLPSIEIPESVTRIEKSGFGSCFGLKEVVLPERLAYLGVGAFQYCGNLEYIYIPASVTIIESICFSECKGLRTLRVKWTTPRRVSDGQQIFKNVDLSAVTLYVPKGTKVLYESAEVWKDFGTIVEDPAVTADDIIIEYGDNIPQLTFSSDVEVIGTPALSCSATPTSPVGTYPITISKGSVENKNVTYVDGTLTIVKAPLTISAGNYMKKQFEVNPKISATYSGFKNGETSAVLTKQPTFTTDVTVSTAPGQYAVKVSGAEAQNYEISYVDGTITVTEADKVTVTANDITMVYGDAVPELTYTSEGAELQGTPIVSCDATSSSPVGTYPITVAKGSVENKNVSLVNATLTIVKAPLTISAGNYTKKQGEENPKFTATYSGFKNGETASVLTKQPTFTTDVTTSTAPGQYAVKVSGAEAQNYEIKYVDGSITVMEIEIVEKINTLTLQDLSIDQGTTEAVLPISLTNESSITGFQCDLYLPSGVTVATDEYGDYKIAVARTTASRHAISTSLQADGALRILCTSMTNATFSGNSGRVLNVTLAVPESMAAGIHDMSLKNIVLSDPNANRHTSPDMTSSLIVAEVEKITIRANNITMVYGDAVPDLTYTSEGAELLGTPIVSCEATSFSPVGTYPITISKGYVENYNVEYINGTLTIVKAPLHVMADDCTRAYGEENPVFTVSYEGWVNDEGEEVLTKSATVSCMADEATDVGVYDIVVSGAEAMNYSLTYTNGRLTIEKAMQEIVWEQDLSNVIVGDQVELTATATSGLEITFQLANTDIAEIYEANGKSYLDCLSVGLVVIKAIQNGNKNYHAALRVNKTLVVSNPDGIKDVVDENADAPIYNMLGEQMGCSREELHRGVYIQNGRKFVVM